MQDIGKEELETAETEASEQGVEEVPDTTTPDGTEPAAVRDPSWNEEGAVEAILFAMGDSVELNRLASAIGDRKSVV